MTDEDKLIAAKSDQSPQLSLDDPEQSVRLSFTPARCRATSSAMDAAIINKDPFER